jgi:hypothetical protein
LLNLTNRTFGGEMGRDRTRDFMCEALKPVGRQPNALLRQAISRTARCEPPFSNKT